MGSVGPPGENRRGNQQHHGEYTAVACSLRHKCAAVTVESENNARLIAMFAVFSNRRRRALTRRPGFDELGIGSGQAVDKSNKQLFRDENIIPGFNSFVPREIGLQMRIMTIHLVEKGFHRPGITFLEMVP